MSAKFPSEDVVVGTPRSERSQTRFSTPVSELDDHRHEPIIQVASPSMLAQQRIHQSDHRSANALSPDVMRGRDQLDALSPRSYRDIEHAILDDDKSAHGGHLIEHSMLPSPMLNAMGARRTSRLSQPQGFNQLSMDSSPSSRSTSPANSVDAFADGRRRERANTVDSQVILPDFVDTRVSRTISGGTHCRRPTFSDEVVRDKLAEDIQISPHNPAVKDICFPVKDQPAKSYQIDFEELDEFVQKHRATAPGSKFGLPRDSGIPLSGETGIMPIPLIVTHCASPTETSPELLANKEDAVLSEKLAALNECENSTEHEKPIMLKGSPIDVKDPMRFSFFSSELEQTIHATDFADLITSGEAFSDLFQLPVDSGVWWLDIHNPLEAELSMLQRAFGIHRLTTEDIMTQEAREKVELFNQYYFVCFRSFTKVQSDQHDDWEPVSVYMVVFREGIITITFSPDSPHATNVRKRIGKLRDYMALTADWICYAMIDDIVDAFAPPIHEIEVEADTIEDQVFVARTEDFASLLRQIGHCRKKVMSLMRLLGGKADVIKGFAKRCNEQYSVTPRGDIGLYLGDIQDHVVTMMSNLGHFEKLLGRSHSNYLAQLSVDHIAQGNRTNDNLSKITVLASVLVPLNLICGLFGMNVNVPGKNADGLGWFFGIVGVIFGIVILCLGIARRFRFI